MAADRIRTLFNKRKDCLEKDLEKRGIESLYFLSERSQTTFIHAVIDLFNADLAPRIERLPSKKWQINIHGFFSMNLSPVQDDGTFLNDKQGRGIEDLLERYEKQCRAFEKTRDLLERYENLELITVLELAAWKASCMINGPILNGPPTTFIHWISDGWKQTKKDHYKCNEMEIIVSSVVPFLFRDDYFSWPPDDENSDDCDSDNSNEDEQEVLPPPELLRPLGSDTSDSGDISS